MTEPGLRAPVTPVHRIGPVGLRAPEAADQSLDVLTWLAFDPAKVTALVTTRYGGVSAAPYDTLNLGMHVGDDPTAVRENRRRAAAALGLTADDLVLCHQVHGREVVRVGRADTGRALSDAGTEAVADADALVTVEPGVGLVVMVADCVPIVLHEPDAGVLACVHAGWRGTVARVAGAAVEAMADLGAEPARVVAGLGPAIHPDVYQVGDDVADAARACFGDRADLVVRPDGTGRWLFDGWAANRLVLTDAGVPEGSIHVTREPTGPGTPFFSHRAGAPTGRFAALACLR